MLFNGQVVDVRRGELEVVLPEHRLRPEPDGEQAAWLRDDLYVDPGRLARAPASGSSSQGATTPSRRSCTRSPIRTEVCAGATSRSAPQRCARTRSTLGVCTPSRVPLSRASHTPVSSHASWGWLLGALVGATTTPDDVVVAVW